MRRCDNPRIRLTKDEYIEPLEYVKVNRKRLKVFAVFSKGADYFYLAKLYERSNHYFLISELKNGTCRRFEALSSFTGSEEGLKKTIDVMYRLADRDENYRGLKKIK